MDYFTLTGADKLLQNDGAKLSLYFDKGYIGMFECDDFSSGVFLLKEAVSILKAKGHTKIYGPIDGSTWFSYRLISDTNGEKPFTLEKQNPMFYNDVFESAGFIVEETYYSDISKISDISKMNVNKNIEICKADDIDEALKSIYELSLDGFSNNFLYSDISYEKFLALYKPLAQSIDKDFLLFVKVKGEIIGFIFCIDGLEDRIVLKSMAIKKGFRNLGIGTVLIHHALENAKNKGFTKAIGAYIKSDNISGKITKKYNSEKIREYRLYSVEV